MIAPEREWVVWEAKPGILPLTDGRQVLVQFGDEVLAEERPEAILFHDIRPRTVN